jgi:high-affinity iron transporter
MFAAFVVLLREGFEASLLVAIVLAYLTQIGHSKERRQVWYGVGAAIALSLVLSGVVFATAGELEGPAEGVFEACALFLAVGFLTYMVLWMRRESRHLAGNIRRDVEGAVGRGGGLALAFLVFVMVLREGIETGLFIFGITRASTPLQTAIGATAGILAAVGLGYAVYVRGTRINLGAFFKYREHTGGRGNSGVLLPSVGRERDAFTWRDERLRAVPRNPRGLGPEARPAGVLGVVDLPPRRRLRVLPAAGTRRRARRAARAVGLGGTC